MADFPAMPLWTKSTLGMRIHESDNLPAESFDYSAIWPAHPLIRFLSKWFMISPWVSRRAVDVVQVDKAYVIGQNIFMPRSMMLAIKNDPRVIEVSCAS